METESTDIIQSGDKLYGPFQGGDARQSDGTWAVNGQRVVSRWALVLFVVSLCVCAWGLARLSANDGHQEAVEKLRLVIGRLMLADEVSVDDEVQRANDAFEQVLLEKESLTANADSSELEGIFTLGAKIKDALAAGNRKSAVEMLVEFNKKAAGFEAKVYQTGRNTPMFVIPLVSWIGFIGVMFSFGIIWFIMGRFIDRETHLVNAAQQAADNLNTITSRFEDEQKRSIDLQHRLIDMSKQTTRMETRLDEYARATSQLESLVKYLRTSLTEGEGRVKSLEKELSDAVQRCKDAEVKASSLEAIIDAAGRTEESLRSSLQSLMDQKDEQHLQLSDKIRELTRQLMALAGSSDVTSSLDEDKASSKIEMQDGSNELTLESLAKLQADLIQERTKFQSEFAVIEWTNTKLRNELDELKLELAATKSALTEQEREFRESKLTLEETILSDKRRELDDVTTRYEAEIKFLRDQLRAANDRYADKSA